MSGPPPEGGGAGGGQAGEVVGAGARGVVCWSPSAWGPGARPAGVGPGLQSGARGVARAPGRHTPPPRAVDRVPEQVSQRHATEDPEGSPWKAGRSSPRRHVSDWPPSGGGASRVLEVQCLLSTRHSRQEPRTRLLPEHWDWGLRGDGGGTPTAQGVITPLRMSLGVQTSVRNLSESEEHGLVSLPLR